MPPFLSLGEEGTGSLSEIHHLDIGVFGFVEKKFGIGDGLVRFHVKYINAIEVAVFPMGNERFDHLSGFSIPTVSFVNSTVLSSGTRSMYEMICRWRFCLRRIYTGIPFGKR